MPGSEVLPVVSRPETPGSRTAQAVLDAAEFLFLRQGYHGTSMRQLGRYAGVTPAAIYNHYTSKEDLFVSLLRARLPHRVLALAVQEAQGDSAADLLQDGIRRMRDALEGRSDHLRLAFIELLEFEGRHLPLVLPEILAPAQAFIARLRASDPRLETWPPALILKVVGGGVFALAISQTFLGSTSDLGGTPTDFEGLAAILSAGLLHGGDSVEGRG
jgi:AcrR family transcriptional regulator